MFTQARNVGYGALDPPVGGIFVLEISLMPPLPKICPKTVCPKKGVAFLTEDVFEKNFQVRERIPPAALAPATYGSAATGRGSAEG
jgi:hypothetical protein